MIEAELRLRVNVNVTDNFVFVRHVEKVDSLTNPPLTSVTKDDYSADNYADVLTLTIFHVCAIICLQYPRFQLRFILCSQMSS